MTDRPARVPAQTSPASTSATAAYVRIYEEEQPRLVAYARSLTRNTWAAEDLVAEAHFRVWRRLSAGHEIDNVPAYLMTTVRHLASSVASATHETPRDPQIPEQASAVHAHAEDPAEQVSSTDLLVRVLGELPERWVQALWLADAEGQPLETVGRQIGAKQGATAVLLHRAREGMRQAFLREQTEAPDDPACEVHWVRMPAYVRGNATPRQSERLLAHVDACDGCRGRLAVLIRANNRLPALVGPALLVFAVAGGGAGKFLASLTSLTAGSASAGGNGLLHTARAAGPKAKAALASGTAAAAAVAIVIALGVNESPATATLPGKAPVAQAPVAEPATGTVEESPPGEPSVGERVRTRTRADGVDVGGVHLVAHVQGAGGSEGAGDSGDSGDSGAAGGSDDGGTSGGGGVVDTSAPPEEPAQGGPDPSPSPVVPAPGGEEPALAPEPKPTEPAPEPKPTEPAPEPYPEQPKPTEPAPAPDPEQPKPADPAPAPDPEQPKPADPDPEQPTPTTPGDETPVPEPTPDTPTPADPAPVEETPEPPTTSEPPTAPESPTTPESPAPSDPSETPTTPDPSPDPTPVTPPTPGDNC
ncbi:sigma-70 family RNA polymerase sigma factor [Streptomyces sp. NPDC019531]|uniref:sigma-70 family RNA polymerase sigma factor n=1 Tax=Streptomyces sp. NPDC019531 TaxID=3365062 RepID=UPI00384E13E8